MDGENGDEGDRVLLKLQLSFVKSHQSKPNTKINITPVPTPTATQRKISSLPPLPPSRNLKPKT
jgi:hypothetical protein